MNAINPPMFHLFPNDIHIWPKHHTGRSSARKASVL